MDIIQEFELAHFISYFMMDNAGSNDTLLKVLAKNLLIKYGARINPQKRQIRCLSHIINLALSAFLFTDNKTALKEVLWEAIEEEEEASVCELLIEKLKNIKGLKGRKNKKKDDTPPTIVAVIIIAAMSFFLFFFGVILGRVFAKSRFHFSPFSFNN